MKGTALVIRPGATTTEEHTLTQPVTLKFMQEAVGGYIELVPLFKSISHEGVRRDCLAFCNEEGKLKRLPVNETATQLWHEQLRDDGHGGKLDHLVGNVIVIFGDDEFIRGEEV